VYSFSGLFALPEGYAFFGLLSHTPHFVISQTFMITSEVTATRTHEAYQLYHSSSHREGYGENELPSEYDAWLEHFPGRESYSEYEDFRQYFWQAQRLSFPSGIEFECIGIFLEIYNPTLRRVTDYPYNREGWPIMSKRMLEALLSVREFPHQVIPITMVNLEFQDFDEQGNKLLSRTEIHDYVAVQLLEHQDVFDWEQSVYERDPDRPTMLDSCRRVVLRVPPNGLPPLFRIATVPLDTRLYVSPEGRAALEAAGIRGVSFIESLGI
jgi:hypothetical protein